MILWSMQRRCRKQRLRIKKRGKRKCGQKGCPCNGGDDWNEDRKEKEAWKSMELTKQL